MFIAYFFSSRIIKCEGVRSRAYLCVLCIRSHRLKIQHKLNTIVLLFDRRVAAINCFEYSFILNWISVIKIVKVV